MLIVFLIVLFIFGFPAILAISSVSVKQSQKGMKSFEYKFNALGDITFRLFTKLFKTK